MREETMRERWMNVNEIMKGKSQWIILPIREGWMIGIIETRRELGIWGDMDLWCQDKWVSLEIRRFVESVSKEPSDQKNSFKAFYSFLK